MHHFSNHKILSKVEKNVCCFFSQSFDTLDCVSKMRLSISIDFNSNSGTKIEKKIEKRTDYKKTTSNAIIL